ncbi:hypothetical protein [Paenibacillus sp. FSL R5-0914]|uniref:hypothetical protein n=1 Tax=Paenibacillus sp. FSL R5-0914 TaxID=2921665 RepID=UPI0030F51539
MVTFIIGRGLRSNQDAEIISKIIEQEKKIQEDRINQEKRVEEDRMELMKALSEWLDDNDRSPIAQ